MVNYDYPDFISSTRYGKVDGLCGANCKHSYFPFIPGISTRAYTDEELEEIQRSENEKKEYNGKSYTAYEATQEQRRLERLMKKERQDIKLLKEGGANEEDIITAQARYRITSDDYVKFSKAMGQPQQMERVYGDGLKGKFGNPQSYKIIENRAELYYNGDIKAYLKDETIRKNIRDNANKMLNNEKQNRHQLGTKEYKENRSYLSITNEEAQKLINKYSGTGYIERDRKGNYAKKEFVISDKQIGFSINLETLEKISTNKFYIHYSKTGIHIVPTNKGG